MNSDLQADKHFEYRQAWRYLGWLAETLERLRTLGVAEPWSSALEADITRLHRTLHAAISTSNTTAETSSGCLGGGLNLTVTGDLNALPQTNAAAPARHALTKQTTELPTEWPRTIRPAPLDTEHALDARTAVPERKT